MMLTIADPLTQALLLALVLTVFSFLVLISWRYPGHVFIAIFFLRPLLDMCRIFRGQATVVQWILNGVGITIPAALLLVLVLHKKILLRKNVVFLLLMAFILISAFSHEITPESGEMLIRVLMPFAFILFPQLIIKTEEDLKIFFKIVAVSTVFALFAIVLDRSRTNIHPIYGWVQDAITLRAGGTQNRFAAVFGVPTLTAFWLFQFFAVAYFLFEAEKSVRRWLWMGICLILSVPVFFTFSRAAWLGCWLLIFFYNFLKGRLVRTTAWILGIVALAAIIIPDILFRLQNPQGILGRLSLWSGYVQTLSFIGARSWLLGIGWANLPEKNIFSGSSVAYGSTGLVENSFLFILIVSGVLTLILLVIGFLCLARRANWLMKKGETSFIRDFGAWSLAMIIVWFAMSMTGEMVTYVVINWYWYAYFGCILGLWKHRKYSVRQSECTEVSLSGVIWDDCCKYDKLRR